MNRVVLPLRPPPDHVLTLACLGHTDLWWIAAGYIYVPSTLHWLLRAIQGRHFVRGDYLYISSTTIKGTI